MLFLKILQAMQSILTLRNNKNSKSNFQRVAFGFSSCLPKIKYSIKNVFKMSSIF